MLEVVNSYAPAAPGKAPMLVRAQGRGRCWEWRRISGSRAVSILAPSQPQSAFPVHLDLHQQNCVDPFRQQRLTPWAREPGEVQGLPPPTGCNKCSSGTASLAADLERIGQ